MTVVSPTDAVSEYMHLGRGTSGGESALRGAVRRSSEIGVPRDQWYFWNYR